MVRRGNAFRTGKGKITALFDGQKIYVKKHMFGRLKFILEETFDCNYFVIV